MNLRILILFLPAFVSMASSAGLEVARSAVKEWAIAEKAISREAAGWALRESLLLDLIQVETQRIDRLEAEKSESEAGMNASDEERRELLERQSRAQEMTAKIEAFLEEIEVELYALKLRLPEPLVEELAVAYQRLPGKGDRIRLSLGERMQTVIGIMVRIRQFDGRFNVSESTRELPDGGEALVRTIYAGLGQAYYLAPNDAGYGTPETTGWVWQSAPEYEGAIRDALQILDGEAPEPKFISLPIHSVHDMEVSE